MKIVNGKDILWGYNCKNYDDGEGMGSCMRYEQAQKYLSIYVNNPNEISLIVLVNPQNGAIRGRALLWTLDDGSKFMDRVYTTNKQYEAEFNNYAQQKGFGISKDKMLGVQIANPQFFNSYPYMDTFVNYVPAEGYLSNIQTIPDNKKNSILYLHSTDGSYDENVWIPTKEEYAELNDDVVFVNYLGEYVPKVWSTYSKRYKAWLYVDDDYTTKTSEGETILNDDAVTLYNGQIAHIDDAKMVDDDNYVLRHTSKTPENWALKRYGNLFKWAKVYVYNLENKWRAKQAIDELKSITHLTIEDSDDKKLPIGIGDLKNLTTLIINNTTINYFPESFTDLSNLKELYVSDTPLRKLPINLDKLKKLIAITFRDTFIDKKEVERIKQLLPNVMISNH